MIRKFCLLFLLLVCSFAEARQLPELEPATVKSKLNEIMKAHVTYKKVNTLLVKRALENFIDELDPTKTYFIETDIHQWLEPSDEMLNQVLQEYEKGNFDTFEQIYHGMIKAIDRRHEIEKKINLSELPKHVNPEQFRDMKWAANEQELLQRLIEIRGLQLEAASKLSDDMKEKSLQRIAKRQAKYEAEFLMNDPVQHRNMLLSDILKAFASSLDAHTAYFTPDEANQFMINVQQRLFGIGAQLRDDINGFSVIKIIEGGPASHSDLKVGDRIIAVNNEPVVGMDIEDAVHLIRGDENTIVTLTVIRETEEAPKHEDKFDILITRGEVVLKETRYDTSYEPYGDGVIAYLRLHSFYQDSDTSSSAADLARELKKLKEEHKVLGVILDLRYNSGGLLAQAVSVTGLFITKGIVVSIKDENGNIQHLRDLDGKTVWDGPLIVLVNRGSASASEIVAQTLKDYGRALIIGDDHTYGKGSFQTFTLNAGRKGTVNPQGEYKVTRGKYYTVGGNSPQRTGVISDIVVPGTLSEMEIGENFAKNPLDNDTISENFQDDLSDIPYSQREKVSNMYRFNLQKRLQIYNIYLTALKKNSEIRIKNNKNYQSFLKDLKKKDKSIEVIDEEGEFGENDLQLAEAYSIMKDLIILMIENPPQTQVIKVGAEPKST